MLEIARRILPYHQRTYLIVLSVIVLSQFIWPTVWWFFWPLIIWTVVFLLHLMVIRTIDVQDDWVDDRTEKLADNAFDFGHISAIREKMAKDTYGEAYGHKTTEDTDKKS